MRRFLWALLLALPAMGLAPVSAGAVPRPRIALDTNGGDVRVAALDGTESTSVPNASPYFSFSGGVLAVARPTLNGGSRVVGIDGTTGSRLFTIKDGFFPLIAGQGSRVVFLPDAHAGGPNDRDPTLNSVWYDDVASGHDHRLVRFTDSDRIPLNLAISPKGGRVAITQGNDADLFQWDIWTATTTHHLVRRLTTDGISTYPSFSPSGLRIAFAKVDHTDPCSGSIWIMNGDGRSAHRLVAGTCARHYLRPVWLDTHTLIAWAWGPHGVRGLVTIDVASGAVSWLVHARVVDFSVSRAMGKVALRVGAGEIYVVDVKADSTSSLPFTPAGSRVFLSGALELAY
jgi:dipeptidyl aminopeptidase/acylaminoacyl peptidase